MQEPEPYVYFTEVVILILSLATPVLTAFFVGALIYFRKAPQRRWLRAFVLAIVSTAAAFALTFAIWVALSFAEYYLPEPIFMIGGFINGPALASCVIVGMVVAMSRGLRRRARTAG